MGSAADVRIEEILFSGILNVAINLPQLCLSSSCLSPVCRCLYRFLGCGPHWDVQTPSGKYRDVYPGSKIR
jgi:hypothetical protein